MRHPRCGNLLTTKTCELFASQGLSCQSVWMNLAPVYSTLLFTAFLFASGLKSAEGGGIDFPFQHFT